MNDFDKGGFVQYILVVIWFFFCFYVNILFFRSQIKKLVYFFLKEYFFYFLYLFYKGQSWIFLQYREGRGRIKSFKFISKVMVEYKKVIEKVFKCNDNYGKYLCG